jgi:sarcosine oxidase subunit beta
MPTGQVSGVETSRGFIGAKKIGVVAAGHTSVVMDMAGVRMPLESYPLQALVSEPVKPCFPCVVMSNTVHAYLSQSDKGELVIGAGTDQYVSYARPAGCTSPPTRSMRSASCFRCSRRMRMLRNWGGIVDVTPDRSPIIGKTPVPGLYVNCGWGTGGFKATPGSGQCLRAYHRARRAAQDQRPVHARKIQDRPADRRGGSGRRGALRQGRCC